MLRVMLVRVVMMVLLGRHRKTLLIYDVLAKIQFLQKGEGRCENY